MKKIEERRTPDNAEQRPQQSGMRPVYGGRTYRPPQRNDFPAHFEQQQHQQYQQQQYQQQRDYPEQRNTQRLEHETGKGHSNIPFMIVFILMIIFFFAWVYKPTTPVQPTPVKPGQKAANDYKTTERETDQKETRPAAEDIRTAQSVWASKDTPINKFDYYIDGDEIFIKKYKGSDRRVRIGSSYNIDGKTCYVAGLTDATFLFSRVDSIIIPEGVRSIAHHAFNSCGAKFFFLPSTLTNVDESFWGYFFEAKKIYYGGTREQWDEIFNVDRGELEVEEIIFDAKSEDLK